VTQRFLNQLKDEFPSHPFVLSLAEKEAEFEREAAKYSATKA
jgi:hypothetical protein